MRLSRIAIAAFAIVVLSAPALAKNFTLNFDGPDGKGIPPVDPANPGLGSAVLGYYNGDPGLDRSGSQQFDVTFTAGALSIATSSGGSGGFGNFGIPPSPFAAVGNVDGEQVSFELSEGISLTSLAFAYNALPSAAASFQLFSSDSSLGKPTDLDLCLDPGGGGFCGWTKFLLTAQELANLAGGKLVTGVTFNAAANQAVFDDISLSTTAGNQPVPEPSSLALVVLGLALTADIARRRRG